MYKDSVMVDVDVVKIFLEGGRLEGARDNKGRKKGTNNFQVIV